MEYFPAKVLHHIFTKLNDIGLLNVAITSVRFHRIAKIVFKEKYTNEYFLFNGEREKQREIYKELFSYFGRYADLKAIEVKRMRSVNEKHWTIQLLHQYTNQLEKLSFEDCSFTQLNEILSRNVNVEHLALRSVEISFDRGWISLPNYRNLKKLELSDLWISTETLTRTFQNNPSLESLTIRFTRQSTTIYCIANYLKQLKELNLLNATQEHWDESDEWLDMIADSLKHLKSLSLDIDNDYQILIERLGLVCKNIKHLGLTSRYEQRYSIGMVGAIRQFDTIESLSLTRSKYNNRIELIVEFLPNLRELQLSMDLPRSNAFLLELLRKCLSLERITMEFRTEAEPRFFVNLEFFDEIRKTMRKPNGKIEFKSGQQVIGFVTKQQIVWRNKLLYWIGYDPSQSTSNVNLLDLSKPLDASGGCQADKRNPFDHILEYLDLGSLYSMSTVNKQCKKLIDGYVDRHAKESGTFIMTDEFLHDDHFQTKLDVFAEHVENLALHSSRSNFNDYLLPIQSSFKNLHKLCIWSTDSFCWAYNGYFSHVRDLVLNVDLLESNDGMDPNHFDLITISEIYSNLETLEIKRKVYIPSTHGLKFHNLKTFTYRYVGETQNKILEKLFKNSNTKLIPIR